MTHDRRSFLSSSFASLALGAMLHRDGILRADEPWLPPTGQPHFPPKIKRVIWLFMIGGASHVEATRPTTSAEFSQHTHSPTRACRASATATCQTDSSQRDATPTSGSLSASG